MHDDDDINDEDTYASLIRHRQCNGKIVNGWKGDSDLAVISRQDITAILGYSPVVGWMVALPPLLVEVVDYLPKEDQYFLRRRDPQTWL